MVAVALGSQVGAEQLIMVREIIDEGVTDAAQVGPHALEILALHQLRGYGVPDTAGRRMPR